MKSLEQQIGGKCIHFNGLVNKKCDKGITYQDVKEPEVKPFLFPCLKGELRNGGSCELCEFPSKEEVDKQVKEINERQKATIGNLVSVKQHYAKTKETSGVLKCQGCGGELHYAVAKINGHTRATCKGCEMGWIE